MFPFVEFTVNVKSSYRAKARLRASEVGTIAEVQLCTCSGNNDPITSPNEGMQATAYSARRTPTFSRV